jgi:hypothetical protein
MLTTVQDWRRRGVDGVTIHGWVYHLEDVGGLGLLRARLS